MLILKMAFRNIFRHKRRSILTGMLMAGACALFSVSFGMVDGSYGGIIDMFTRNHTGHIQIHKDNYLNKPSIYKNMPDYEAIGKVLDSNGEVEAWAPRIKSGALAFFGKKTTGVQVLGIDPEREAKTTRIKQKVKEGRYFSGDELNEIIVSDSLSKLLKANLGDKLALIAQGADGSIANDLFTIVGITDNGSSGYGAMTCYMSIKSAQEFLYLHGRAHELAIVVGKHTQAREVAESIDAMLDRPELDVDPWQIVEEQFYKAMQADLKGNWISLFVLTIIISVGVFNTILMMILERTHEYGVLKAIGTRPTEIFTLIQLETAILSSISIMIGLMLGTLGNYYLMVYGLTMPPIDYGGVTFDTMRAAITPRTFYIPSILILSTSQFVSIFPAIMAARVVPVKALRAA